jgi:hypothetical protein
MRLSDRHMPSARLAEKLVFTEKKSEDQLDQVCAFPAITIEILTLI